MSHFTSVTPNLIVSDVSRSTAFYRDILGFSIKETVPAAEPFVFVWLERESVSVFLNDFKAAAADLPVVTGRAFTVFPARKRSRSSASSRAEA